MVVWNFKIYNIFNNVVELFSFSHSLSVNIVLVRMNYSLFASGSERETPQRETINPFSSSLMKLPSKTLIFLRYI